MRRGLGYFIFLFALQGCKVGPDYEKPVHQFPKAWKNAAVSSQDRVTEAWWENFRDPLLNSLMKEAVQNNLSLKEAAAHLNAALQQMAQVDLAVLPTLNLTGSEVHRHISQNIATFSPGYSVPKYDTLSLGVTTSWEIDLWGRLRRSEEAAKAAFGVRAADVKGVLLSLYVDVAKNYILLRSAQTQLAFQKELTGLCKDALDLTQVLMLAGKANEQAVLEAKKAYETSLALEAPLEIAIKTALHQVALLLGKTPGAFYAKLSNQAPIPLPVPTVFSGLPSNLLERRPDVQAAERTLAQNTAEIGVLTGNLFPQFSLTGSWGYSSTGLGNLVEPKSIASAVGPSFKWPIFDFGQIKAGIKAQEAERDAARYAYDQVVLQALGEVETALVTLKNNFIGYEKMKAILASGESEERLTESLYGAGTANYLVVIQKKQAKLQDALNMTRSAEAYAIAAVTLYKALGAGIPLERGTESQKETF